MYIFKAKYKQIMHFYLKLLLDKAAVDPAGGEEGAPSQKCTYFLIKFCINLKNFIKTREFLDLPLEKRRRKGKILYEYST